MRPGAGTDVTVNSGRAIVAIFGAEPVGDRTRVRGQIEIGRPGLELEQRREVAIAQAGVDQLDDDRRRPGRDRKSTRLNSSHVSISYAVFCLKKKKSNLLNASVSSLAPGLS